MRRSLGSVAWTSLDDCDSDSEEEESQSSDDEEYELVAEEEDPLYELGGGNQDLEMSIDDLLSARILNQNNPYFSTRPL